MCESRSRTVQSGQAGTRSVRPLRRQVRHQVDHPLLGPAPLLDGVHGHTQPPGAPHRRLDVSRRPGARPPAATRPGWRPSSTPRPGCAPPTETSPSASAVTAEAGPAPLTWVPDRGVVSTPGRTVAELSTFSVRRRVAALDRGEQELGHVEDLDVRPRCPRSAAGSARRRTSPGRTGSRWRSSPRPVSRASSTRSRLTRLPIFSSIHMRAPPAPQQKERSACRGISASRTPAAPTSSRGSA